MKGGPTNLTGGPTNMIGGPTNMTGGPTNTTGGPTNKIGGSTNTMSGPTNRGRRGQRGCYDLWYGYFACKDRASIEDTLLQTKH